jgi:hypothetical protein
MKNTLLTAKQRATIESFGTLEAEKVFEVFLFGIYEKIPKYKWHTLAFVSQENGLLQMQAEAKPLFWLRKNDAEKTFVEKAITVCAKNEPSQVPRRIRDCAKKFSQNSIIHQEVLFLFEHYTLNHRFPWVVSTTGNTLLCKDNKIVLTSDESAIVEFIATITHSAKEEVIF